MGLPGSPEARRFLDEVVVTGNGEGAQAAPIQHHIAALASNGEQGNEASTSAIQEVWQQVVAASPSSSSSSSPSSSPALQPHFVSSPGDLLSHPPTQCLLLCPSAFFSSSSTALFDYAIAALSAGKSVLIPRPASLQLSSSQAKALTQLAKEKRAWLGIMVVKRKAATKATKRLTAVQEAATAINGASAHPSGLAAPAMTPSASSTGSTSSNSLRWAADECARCRERGLAESSMIGWEDNVATLECLDEIRESGAVLGPTQPPIRSESSSSLPDQVTSSQSSQDTAEPLPHPTTPKNRILDIGPRQFRKTPVPDSRRVEELKAQEGVAGAGDDVQEDSSMSLTSQDESYDSIQSGSAAAMQRDILELKHLLRQKDAHIAALMEARGEGEGDPAGENGRAAGDVVLPLSKAAGSSKLNSKAAAIRLSMPVQGYGATAAAAASRLPRRRGSSVGSFSNSNSEASTPTRATFPTMGTSASINPIEPVSGAGSRSASATSSTPGGRARRDAGTTPPTPAVPLPLGTSNAANAQHAGSLDTMLTSSPRVSVNGQSLKEVKEAEDEPTPSTPSQQQTGFLAPTRASESRRKNPATPSSIPRHRRSSLSPAPSAAAAAAAASPRTPSPSPSSSTPPPAAPARPPSPDLLVQRLTNDVEQYRSSLDSTRQQLQSTQRNLSSLQRMYDSTKEALASSRVESERRETALLRKEKALSEALERARRAEGEVKELGRSSREWGTRVRVVEAELGEVRRMTAKAEGSYEALRGAWANTRAKWEGEVKGLREELRRTVAEHRQAAREAQRRLEEVEEEWKGREGQRKGLEAVLEALKGEREKARHQVVAEVGRLVQRVAKGEEVRMGHEADVRGVMDELERLKRLMRAGVDEA